MSNERIDQILEDTIPFFRANEERSPHYADLIRKTMEQYGKEQYEQGCINIIKANPDLDLTRLRSLVQAQKRLIDLIETKNEYPFWWISAYRNKRKLKKILINIIKRLEQ